jgi:DNA polymerase-3 subunit epsilon
MYNPGPMSDESASKPTRWPVLGEAPTVAELGPRFFSFLEQLSAPVVFFDLETTGTDVQRDRIVEICLLRVRPLPHAIEQPRTWRVNPGVRIPSEASEIHGIKDEDVADCPGFGEIADEVLEMIEGAILSGFAITRMDIRLLQSELLRIGKPRDLSGAKTIDSQVIFHKREPRNLGAAMQYYCESELEGAHGAEADTVASLRVFAGQLTKYEDLGVEVDALHELSASFNTAFVDGGRRFIWRDGEPTFNFGKLRGKSLRWAAGDPTEREYLRWIAGGPFEEDVRQIVSEALAGKIRRKS